MKRYCLGFYFDPLFTEVALIENPTTGKLNGLGGKIESGESPHDAMVREFHEEGGLMVPAWRPFAHLFGAGWSVQCLASTGWGDPSTQEEGYVGWFKISDLPHLRKLRSNVLWLVHLALDRGDGAGMPELAEVSYP